jgi:hypothetical protein
VADIPELDALVLPPRKPDLDHTTIGGLPLVERAVLALHQAGVQRIVVATERVDGPRLLRNLATRHIAVEFAPASASVIRPDHAAIVVTSDAIFEPAAVAALVHRGAQTSDQVTVVTGALAALVAYVPPALVDRARAFGSVSTALWSFYRQQLTTRVEIAPAYCQPVPVDGHVWHLEAQELRRRLGPPSWYARPLRALSRPVTQLGLRVGIPPTALVGLSLGFSLLAAVEISQRGGVGMMTGALLLVGSIVLVFAGRDMERAGAVPRVLDGRAGGDVDEPGANG